MPLYLSPGGPRGFDPDEVHLATPIGPILAPEALRGTSLVYSPAGVTISSCKVYDNLFARSDERIYID